MNEPRIKVNPYDPDKTAAAASQARRAIAGSIAGGGAIVLALSQALRAWLDPPWEPSLDVWGVGAVVSGLTGLWAGKRAAARNYAKNKDRPWVPR